jgi:hypothetical protein
LSYSNFMEFPIGALLCIARVRPLIAEGGFTMPNRSSFSAEPSVLSFARHPPARQDMALPTGLKVRHRWPFTVEPAYGATSPQSPDHAPSGPQSSSFVT